MKRILVTGGAGFIGSHTVDLLLQRGYAVRIFDGLQERVHPRGTPAYLPDDAELIVGDVCEPEAFGRALEGVDAVFHLAAYQDYMPDFSTFYRVNTVSTALLFEIVVANRLPIQKVVLASSQAVYGEGTYSCDEHGVFHPPCRSAQQLAGGHWDIDCRECGRPAEPQPIDESTVNPHTPYGISKWALEQTSLNLGRKYDIDVVNLRYSIVQGPRNSFYNAYSGIARIFTLRALHNQPPICYEDGRQLRDYVYVGDVAKANLLVMEDDRANGKSFNVAGRHATSVLEYAHHVTKACGVELEPVLSGDYRFGDTRHTTSSARALSELGWSPQVPLETFLGEYVEWVRCQDDLEDFYSCSESQMRSAGVLRSVGAEVAE